MDLTSKEAAQIISDIANSIHRIECLCNSAHTYMTDMRDRDAVRPRVDSFSIHKLRMKIDDEIDYLNELLSEYQANNSISGLLQDRIEHLQDTLEELTECYQLYKNSQECVQLEIDFGEEAWTVMQDSLWPIITDKLKETNISVSDEMKQRMQDQIMENIHNNMLKYLEDHMPLEEEIEQMDDVAREMEQDIKLSRMRDLDDRYGKMSDI